MYISPFVSRFTVCGSRLLDERIKRDLRQIVNFLRTRHADLAWPLAAIWLGGDYGRGEGAVFRVAAEAQHEKPWFDYVLYLLYQECQPEAEMRLFYATWEQQLQSRLGLTIILRSVEDLQHLTQLPPSLENYHLCQAYQTLWGDSHLKPALATAFSSGPEMALEYLLVACLRWLAVMSEQPDPETERDIFYRSALAAADACLLVHNQYHSSLRIRAQHYHRWQQEMGLRWPRELNYLYQEGVQYRFLPSDFGQMPLSAGRKGQLSELLLQSYYYLLGQWLQTPIEPGNSVAQTQSYLRKHSRRGWRLFRKTATSFQQSLLELACLLPYVLIDETVPPATPLPDVYAELGDTASWPARIRLFLAYGQTLQSSINVR